MAHLLKRQEIFVVFVVAIFVVTMIYVILHVSSHEMNFYGSDLRHLKYQLNHEIPLSSTNVHRVNNSNMSVLFPRWMTRNITIGELNTSSDESYYNGTRYDLDSFKTVLSLEERHDLLFIFRMFMDVCFRNNLTFFLYGGSLLGSYRHHDIIPWDDDIDIMMNSSQKETIFKTMSSVGGGFQFYLSNTSNVASKFYHKTSRFLPNRLFRWPYVDIFFFKENQSHIFDEMPQYRADYVFRKIETFPLLHRLFVGLQLPVPFDTKSVLYKTYTPSICKRTSFSHKLESNVRQSGRSTPCKHLYGSHTFVFRGQYKEVSGQKDRKHKCIQDETLKIGDKELYTVSVETICVS